MGKAKKRGMKDIAAYYIRLNESRAEIHEWVAFLLLAVMALQPLQGITAQAYDNNEVILLFYRRALLIRGLGYISLANALVFYIRRLYTEGKDILKETFLRRPWNSLFLLLLIWSFICIWHAQHRDVAIGGDPVRFEGFLSYLAYAGFFAGASLVRSEQLQKYLFYTMAFAATVLGLLSLYCLYNPSPLFLSYQDVNLIGGLSGTFVNTNHYGYYLSTMGTLMFALAFIAREKWFKVLFVMLGLYQCAVLVINNTMGSILAILAGVFALILLAVLQKGGLAKKAALGSLAGIAVLIVAVVAFCMANPQRSAFTNDVVRMMEEAAALLSGTAEDSAGSGRLGIWRACIAHIREYPLMGAGTDNAYYAVEPFLGESKMPHNEYLNIGVNLGIPGMLLHLGALGTLFVSCLRRLKTMPAATLTAFCCAFSYAVSAFFGVPLCTMLPFFYIFLSLCAFDAEPEEEEEPAAPSVKEGKKGEKKKPAKARKRA